MATYAKNEGVMLLFFPPVVIGSVITVIGLSLLPVAGGWLGGGDSAAAAGDPTQHAEMVACAEAAKLLSEPELTRCTLKQH